MKTINLELSKRLAPYLEDRDTKYLYIYIYEYLEKNKWDIIKSSDYVTTNPIIKTLTLEEAIDFVLYALTDEDSLQLGNTYISFFIKGELVLELSTLSLLQAMEKIIEYLLDNNLISK